MTVARASVPSVPYRTDSQAWWEIVSSWFNQSLSPMATVGIILVGSFIVWAIGQLIIRGIVRGISDGLDWTENQARDVLVKVKLSSAEEQSVTHQLADARRSKRAATIGMVLKAGLNVVVFAVTLLMVLSELGVSVTPILASAGVAGVALGFGAQSLVKDILNGIFMLLEDQFGVGDVVNLGEASGAVEEIGLRTTKVRSLDGTVWFVPNGEIRRVGNMTQLWSRVFIEVRFAYDADIEAARQAMLDAAAMAAEDPDVAAALVGEPEVAGVELLEYNAVMLRLIIKVRPLTQWAAMRVIRRHMRDLFVERGIRLAAPEGSLIQSQGDLPAPRPSTKQPSAKRTGAKQAGSKVARPRQAKSS